MKNNLYICNAKPQTKTTLTTPICGSNFGTHYRCKDTLFHGYWDGRFDLQGMQKQHDGHNSEPLLLCEMENQ